MTFLALIVACMLGSGSAALAADAETTTELIEKGVYAEDVLGDIERAISLYKQVATISGAPRASVARALFRLGVCHSKSGRHADANAAFSLIIKDYPEQQELLGKIPTSPVSVSRLRPPFTEDEVLVLHSVTRPVFELYRSHTETRDGKKVIRIDRSQNGWQLSSAIVDYDTMWPIERHDYLTVARPLLRISYGARSAKLLYHDRTAMRRQDFAHIGAVYDPATLVFLVRRLPLAVGFLTQIPYLDATVGASYATVNVVGIERVTVAAGTFDAYRVRLTLSEVEEQEWWLSSDDAHYPVKMEPSGHVLTRIPKQVKTDSAQVEAQGTRATVTMPKGWAAAPSTLRGSSTLELLAPGLTVRGQFFLENEPPTSRDSIAQPQPTRPQAHSLGGGDPRPMELSGLAAVQTVADRDDGSVVYRTHFDCGGGQRVVVSFEIRHDDWLTFKPVLDSIVSSLRVER